MDMIKTISAVALIIAVTATIPLSVSAVEDSVHFNAPMDFAGTGCPAGSITIEEGSTTLTVLFDSYFVESESELQRRSCNFAVSVHVPAGWQISLLTADWRGFAQGEADFQREYFLADQTGGMKIITHFNDPDNNGIDYTEQDSLDPGAYTSCQSEDRDVVLRINSSIRIINTTSEITMDSVDMDNKIVFKLNSKTCRQGGLPFIPLLLF